MKWIVKKRGDFVVKAGCVLVGSLCAYEAFAREGARVVIADLNEDHRADVLAIRSGQQILEAHLSQGGGSFTTTNYVQQHPAWHFSDLAVSPLKRGEPIRIHRRTSWVIAAGGEEGSSEPRLYRSSGQT